MVKHRLTGLFILVFFLSGVYVFVFSESGFLERKKYESGKRSLEKKIEDLSGDNKRLKTLLDSYRRGEITDDDLLSSGYLPERARVLILNGTGDDNRGEEKKTESSSPTPEIDHLRILWVVFSLFSVAVYLTRNIRIPDRKNG